MIEELFPHAEIVAEAIAPARAAELRRDLAFERYALFDRGSYHVAPFADDRALREILARAPMRLAVTSARVLRLRAGDYLLARHDEVHAEIAARSDTRRRFELVLDLSPVPAAAEVHYRKRGQVFFRVPCAPGSLAIVERTAAVTCNHTYVTKLAPHAEIVRLIVQTTES